MVKEGQSFFSIDKAATTRNTIPAQNKLCVKNHTTMARSTAGISIRSKRMSNMIIMPIITRTTSTMMSVMDIESKMPNTAKITAKGTSIIVFPKDKIAVRQ
jgi:hypothetical protein